LLDNVPLTNQGRLKLSVTDHRLGIILLMACQHTRYLSSWSTSNRCNYALWYTSGNRVYILINSAHE